MFVELEASRQFNQAGPQPLTPVEIKSHLEVVLPKWQDFKKVYRHIMAMDAVAMAHYIKAAREK